MFGVNVAAWCGVCNASDAVMLWYPEQDGYIYTVQHREVDVNAADEWYPSLVYLSQ